MIYVAYFVAGYLCYEAYKWNRKIRREIKELRDFRRKLEREDWPRD